VKPAYGWLALAAVALCGCGGAAHQEALGFCRILANGQAGFAGANATEKDLGVAASAWADVLIKGGAGRGDQLLQNAKVAGDMANSADQVSTQIGQLRKAVYDQPLKEEFVQGVRSTLITQLTSRQRTLQELRSAFTESAAQFRELSQMRAYKGDSYPTAIDKLNQMLQGHKPPEDAVGNALAALKEQYGIKDADFATQSAAK
jgi:hypothetical protein